MIHVEFRAVYQLDVVHAVHVDPVALAVPVVHVDPEIAVLVDLADRAFLVARAITVPVLHAARVDLVDLAVPTCVHQR